MNFLNFWLKHWKKKKDHKWKRNKTEQGVFVSNLLRATAMIAWPSVIWLLPILSFDVWARSQWHTFAIGSSVGTPPARMLVLIYRQVEKFCLSKKYKRIFAIDKKFVLSEIRDFERSRARSVFLLNIYMLFRFVFGYCCH